MSNTLDIKFTSPTLGATLRLYVLSDDDDEDDEDQQQHEDAAYGHGEHGRVLAQLVGAVRGARARRGQRRRDPARANGAAFAF